MTAKQLGLTDRPGYRSAPRPDWADTALRSYRLTQLEDRLFDLHRRIENGCAAWDEDAAAGVVADYTADDWEHKALMERLIAEQRETVLAIVALEGQRRSDLEES